MSVVVNVMLSLMSVMSPPPALCNLSGAHCGEIMYFGCFGFRGELGFLNCDDVCMCVVNKQFEIIEFVFYSFYVDLQYDEISLTFTAGYVCLCGVFSPGVVLGLSVRFSWYLQRWRSTWQSCKQHNHYINDSYIYAYIFRTIDVQQTLIDNKASV